MTTTVDVPVLSRPNLRVGVYQFARGYYSEAGQAPEYPLLFLPSPFMLSTILARSMSGTKATTGLVEWYCDNPKAQAAIYPEVVRTSKYSRQAIRVNVEKGILEQKGLYFVPNPRFSNTIPKEPVDAEMEDRPFSTAYRLGQWCGQIRSTKSIYTTLGLTV